MKQNLNAFRFASTTISYNILSQNPIYASAFFLQFNSYIFMYNLSNLFLKFN